MISRILWINAFMFLIVFNFLVFQKEKLLSSGRVVYLELVPLDPRSLLQGDYMSLRFQVTSPLRFENDGKSEDGYLIAKVDAQGVATYSRRSFASEMAAPDEVKLKFRKRGPQIRIGTDSFFFQSGKADHYNSARYGVFKVSSEGDVLLVGLASAPGKKL